MCSLKTLLNDCVMKQFGCVIVEIFVVDRLFHPLYLVGEKPDAEARRKVVLMENFNALKRIGCAFTTITLRGLDCMLRNEDGRLCAAYRGAKIVPSVRDPMVSTKVFNYLAIMSAWM